jgi:OmcA/MtrC family decaheme c-type cytochrome
VCHTPALGTPVGSGELTFFIHRIHGREKLSAATAAVALPGNILPSEITYPQRLDNCNTCHQGASGARWNTNPSRYACTTCHDTVSFVSPAPAGQTLHSGGARADDTACAGCHDPATIIGYHTNPTLAQSAKFQVIIDSVTNTAPTQFPVVVFRIVDPTTSNTPWTLTATPFTRPAGASRLALNIALSNSDFTNVGTGANFGQPITIDLLAAGAPVTGPDAVTGAYTVTSPTAIPANATGQGTVAIDGHPAFDPGTGTNVRIPMTNASKAFAITGTATTARRAVVDIAKCNKCHFNLSLHGNNRTGDITTCTICHNTEATDGSRRPNFATPGTLGVDGKVEEGIDFKYLIHSIHGTGLSGGGVVVYGFGSSVNDFRDVTYPQILSNCQACHLAGTYLQPQAVANGTSVFAGADRLDTADNLRTTKYKATCGACHGPATQQAHITQNGGTTGVTQAQINAVNQ